jgi:hypothetical protein
MGLIAGVRFEIGEVIFLQSTEFRLAMGLNQSAI